MFGRVEIGRGPASSLYGPNALFAIVNVVTRRGASLNRVSVDADAGTLGTQLVRGVSARYVRVVGAARVTAAASLDHTTYTGVYPYAGEPAQPSMIGLHNGFSGHRLDAR